MDQHRSGAHHGDRQGTRVDSEALWDWSLESDRIHFSPRWIALVGCDDHEVGSTPEEWLQRVHPDDSAQLRREIDAAKTGDSTSFACRHRLRHKDGTYRWMSCRGAVVRNSGGQAIRLTGSHSDVTVEMVTDRITGLPNRLLLVDRVTHSIDRSRRYKGFHFAVLVIDLGRPARPAGRAQRGDPLLTAVARRLETCLRVPETMPSLRHNDLVARLDGDYFAILLDGLKEISHAKIVADRILGQILNPFPLAAREVRLSASIGIALSPTGYTSADDVLHDAVTALHRAHVLGGSHCEVFDTEILKAEQAELQLEGDFDAALQRGDFELFYQPIVSLVSNEIRGFEALVRWRHPVLGMIAPADFVPIAERTGFIVPLGNWILREACLQITAWQSGLPLSTELSVSVNLSSVQFAGAALVDEIAEALRDSGLEPHRLVLELTEGVAMANPAAVTTLLMRLRAMGVRISVDDFGTGYSSLAYLRQFPIDTLKIDRSFVRGMVTHKDTAEIVASLIGMSRQLGLQVVAEGIEHEDQLAQLRALNCEAGQGNLFAEPLDVDQAAALLKTGLAPLPERRCSTDGPVRHDEPLPPRWIRGRLLLASNRAWRCGHGPGAAGFCRTGGRARPCYTRAGLVVGGRNGRDAARPPPGGRGTASVRADAGTGTPSVARFSGEQGKGAGLGDAPFGVRKSAAGNQPLAPCDRSASTAGQDVRRGPASPPPGQLPRPSGRDPRRRGVRLRRGRWRRSLHPQVHRIPARAV